MNYFLENYLAQILKEKKKAGTKREIINSFKARLPRKCCKYRELLKLFESEIESFDLSNEYL